MAKTPKAPRVRKPKKAKASVNMPAHDSNDMPHLGMMKAGTGSMMGPTK